MITSDKILKINKIAFTLIVSLVLLVTSCQQTVIEVNEEFKTTPYTILLPDHVREMPVPADNPLTEEGVYLGRKLFYDPILSANNTQSCASCHNQANNFTDNGKRFSTGIDGIQGTRISMPLINLAWMNEFFWDGRAATLEQQIFEPVTNPIEMHDTWPNVEAKLNAHSDYPALFHKAFNTSTIDSNLVVKALAQFLRSMVSFNSRFDTYVANGGISEWGQFILLPEYITEQEFEGMDIFFSEKGDCFHCHGNTDLFTNNEFFNNGLDPVANQDDGGRALVTGNQADWAKFKTPTVRNLGFSAPYMHDGRFATLRDVIIDHYNSGLIYSPTIDINLSSKHFPEGFSIEGGMFLTVSEVNALLAFLNMLNDSSFITNPDFAPLPPG